MGFADDTDDDGSLFYSLGGIFNLKYSALGRANEDCMLADDNYDLLPR